MNNCCQLRAKPIGMEMLNFERLKKHYWIQTNKHQSKHNCILVNLRGNRLKQQKKMTSWKTKRRINLEKFAALLIGESETEE